MQINDCKRVRRLHFVGIGGAGMSGIAEVLHANGFAVSGSDMSESAVVDYLETWVSALIPSTMPRMWKTPTWLSILPLCPMIIRNWSKPVTAEFPSSSAQKCWAN